MKFQAALRMSAILTFSLISVFLYARCASAQWLTLYTPQQVPIYHEKTSTAYHEKTSTAREAFNAFGCGECHADLAEPSYQSGFRLLGNFVEAGDAPQVSADAVNDLQDRLLPKRSLFSELLKESLQKPAEIVVGGEAFVASDRYSSLYLRKIHRLLPDNQWQQAKQSLNKLNAASQVQKAAMIDYMLMF